MIIGQTPPLPASPLKLQDEQHVTLGLILDFYVQIQHIYGSSHMCQYIFQYTVFQPVNHSHTVSVFKCGKQQSNGKKNAPPQLRVSKEADL